MLGASLYLSEGVKKNLAFVERMYKAGVKTIFTSLHIPEDDKSKTLNILKKVTEKMNAYGMNLITDVSSGTFELYNIDKEEGVSFFKDLGINSLRIDYGFSYEEMKDLSKDFQVVLNASTIDDEACRELQRVGFHLSDITVCHNFYPRENTGLAEEFLYERNAYLKEKGFTIQAFIPGDEEKRGPIYEGLPTLERHRDMSPLEAYLDLTQHYLVDEVLVGDIAMSEENLNRLKSWIEENMITLLLEERTDQLPKNFYDVHENRKDMAKDVVRSAQSRIVLKEESIEPANIKGRPTGTVTIDNNQYGRYAGEIQIMKRNLPADDRVNILGKIKEDNIGLLPYIGAGTQFKFIKNAMD